jgi:hypothetical protein
MSATIENLPAAGIFNALARFSILFIAFAGVKMSVRLVYMVIGGFCCWQADV